jgi:TM2 domain-containing membrane protein YozV
MQAVNQQQSLTDWKAMGADKKIAAGICAILLGSLGVHKFILGYTTEGLIMLLITVLTCGIGAMVTSIIGIVEGIIYLTKSDEEFVRTYLQAKKGWF